MWKKVLLLVITFGCLLVDEAMSQGGAESLPFHGFLPIESIRASAPMGDHGPNDVYEHIAVRRLNLEDSEFLIYPHHHGFEYGQDPERKVYEVHESQDLPVNPKNKFDKTDFKRGKHDDEFISKKTKGTPKFLTDGSNDDTSSSGDTDSYFNPIPSTPPTPAYAYPSPHSSFSYPSPSSGYSYSSPPPSSRSFNSPPSPRSFSSPPSSRSSSSPPPRRSYHFAPTPKPLSLNGGTRFTKTKSSRVVHPHFG